MNKYISNFGGIAAGISSLFILLAVFAPASVSEPDDPVVVRLGDKEVTRSDFNDRFEIALIMLANQRGMPIKNRDQIESLRQQYLERFATEMVLLREAERRGITVSREEIDARAEELLAGFGKKIGTDNLREVLSRAGFKGERQLREIVRERQLIDRVHQQLQEEVVVPPGDVITLHHDIKDQMATPEQVCIRQILVDDERTARELLDKLKSGAADFQALARKESEDPATAERGGDLGCFERGRGGPRTRFERAAFQARKGETVGPVESEFGYHLIEVYDRKAPRVPTLNEAYEELEAELKHEQLPGKIAELRQESGVQTYPARLDSEGANQAGKTR